MTKALTLDEARDALEKASRALASEFRDFARVPGPSGKIAGGMAVRAIVDIARAVYREEAAKTWRTSESEVARQEIAALSDGDRTRAEDAQVGGDEEPADSREIIGAMFTTADSIEAGLAKAHWRADVIREHQKAIFAGIEALRSRDATIADLERRLGMAREVLMAVDWTVTAHGKMDVGTPLHDRVRAALATSTTEGG